MLNTFHVTCAQTLERAYLLKLGGRIVERPQYMFMRIAIGIHGEDLKVRNRWEEVVLWKTWAFGGGGKCLQKDKERVLRDFVIVCMLFA